MPRAAWWGEDSAPAPSSIPPDPTSWPRHASAHRQPARRGERGAPPGKPEAPPRAGCFHEPESRTAQLHSLRPGSCNDKGAQVQKIPSCFSKAQRGCFHSSVRHQSGGLEPALRVARLGPSVGTFLEAPRIPLGRAVPPPPRGETAFPGAARTPGGASSAGGEGGTVFVEWLLETFPIVPNFTQGVVLQDK